MRSLYPPTRLLLGPGPSMVHPRVSAAMARPIVGHLDPFFLRLLDDVQARLRTVFRTANRMTLPISGTGSAGMETCLANAVEEGEEVVIGVNGVFGTRMCEVARRQGGNVVVVEAPWGEIIDPDDMRRALAQCRKPAIVALVHAETSTGVLQPVEEISAAAREKDALFLLDTVTSLAGCDVEIDSWQVDLCYSGTQKCLSAPPGLSPVTVSERAMAKIGARKSPARSWYLDLGLLGGYFGGERVYHHTAPIAMVYALHEALCLVEEEGLPERFARHERNHLALIAGLSVLGLDAAVAEGSRLPMLNSVRVPEGLDDAALRGALLHRHGIEIGAGLGSLAGKVLRIGLMGESSTPENVRRLVTALCAELSRLGCPADTEEALAECDRVY